MKGCIILLMSQVYARPADERVSWLKAGPFILVHIFALGFLFTGFTWRAVILCISLYVIRMFFITASFHRYFAHRSYTLGRVMQFVMAFGATTAAQRGPLWWAGYHRHHHQFSDLPEDIHSPLKGFWWSHVGWILAQKYKATRFDLIEDFAQYPELRWLDRFYLVPPALLGLFCLLFAGLPGLFVGFFLSTTILYHGTFVINSFAHIFGRRRYVTNDTSRNSALLALITLGEGWHNNHHYYRSSTNQGFFWWEFDITYYLLKTMSWFGLVRGMRVPPKNLLKLNRIKDGVFDVGIFSSKLHKAQSMVAQAKIKKDAYIDSRKLALQLKLEQAKDTARELTKQSRRVS